MIKKISENGVSYDAVVTKDFLFADQNTRFLLNKIPFT